MEHSLYKNYAIFNSIEEVAPPYEYARTLSNGDVIGRAIDSQEFGITIEEIREYIKNNHVEQIIE